MRRMPKIIMSGAFMALVFLSLAAGCTSILPGAAPTPTAPSTGEPPSTVYVPASPTLDGELRGVADVVAKVKPSVVAISTEVTSYDLFNRAWTQQGAGSGWIIHEDGWIVTNTHVVEDASRVMVMLDDERTFEAETVYTDSLTDLAVVRISATGLPVASIGQSSSLRVGDVVVAIGNSLGMGISATSGIASAVEVSLSATAGQTLLELIQTDAAINPGNSGGPLVNAMGEVVGINSIKIAQVGVEGMGYAITIDQALPVIESLIAEGRVVRPWLGVGLYTVSPMVASRFDLAVETGVMVTEVVSGSPADQAGLTAGDVIVVFASRDITSTQDFTRAISSLKVGDQVAIVYWRGESKETTIATLGASPPA
jgi:serine protease Do